jgi:hypothetical protein
MLLRGCFVLCALAQAARAGTVVGRFELPPAPARVPVAAKGFLDRMENPLVPVRDRSVAPYLVVVLEGEAKPESPGQVSWDLVGESFARPVVAAPVGAEVVIKNTSRTARTLVAIEDPKLVPSGPINPTGPKSFRVTEPKLLTIADKDAPHLRGKLVVVNTPYVTSVDDAGKFELTDVAEGAYKLRVFYYDPALERAGGNSTWLALSGDAEAVTVPKRGKVDINRKLPAWRASTPPTK